MRVLYLHQYYQTRDSYGITRSHEMARALSAAGHEVTIITGDRSYQSGQRLGRRGWQQLDRSQGFTVISVGVFFSYRRSFFHRAGAFAAYFLLAILAALRAGPFEVVLATSPPLTAGLAGVVISRLKRCPLVFEVRDLWPEVIEQLGVVRARVPLAALYAMARFVYRRAARVIAVTSGVQAYLRVHWRIPEQKLALVAHGSDLDLFAGLDRDEARTRLGFGNDFVVIYAGAIGIAQRLEMVVEAASQVHGSIRFLLIGEGMERKRLQQLAQERSLDQVTFLPPLPRHEIAEYLLAADVGLINLRALPVFRTTIPSKFFDYLGAGLPVAVSFAGDLATLVEAEGIGVAAGDNDPTALAQALVRLRDHPALRSAMSQRCRELAQTRFNRTQQAEALEKVLQEVTRE